jgi:hypothetical protein
MSEGKVERGATVVTGIGTVGANCSTWNNFGRQTRLLCRATCDIEISERPPPAAKTRPVAELRSHQDIASATAITF